MGVLIIRILLFRVLNWVPYFWRRLEVYDIASLVFGGCRFSSLETGWSRSSRVSLMQAHESTDMGVSTKTLNRRIPIIRSPKEGTPYFRKLPCVVVVFFCILASTSRRIEQGLRFRQVSVHFAAKHGSIYMGLIPQAFRYQLLTPHSQTKSMLFPAAPGPATPTVPTPRTNPTSNSTTHVLTNVPQVQEQLCKFFAARREAEVCAGSCRGIRETR